MSQTLIALGLIIILILAVASTLREKQVPSAAARSGAYTVVKHKRNTPTDFFFMKTAEKRAKFKTYGYSKRHKKKLGRSNGIQTLPTESSGDDPEPSHPFMKGVSL